MKNTSIISEYRAKISCLNMINFLKMSILGVCISLIISIQAGVLVDAMGISKTYVADSSVILRPPQNPTQVKAGSFHTCIITTAQQVHCVGQSADGRKGNGVTTGYEPALFGADLGSAFSQVAAYDSQTCALTTTQQIYCAGLNSIGQLGNGNTNSQSTPVRFGESLGSVFAQMAGGYAASFCATTVIQQVYCAGGNASGQLNNGNTNSQSNPVRFGTSLGNIFTQVGAGGGGGHICALTVAQQIYCNGTNNFGQLGNGNTSNQSTPVRFGTSLGDIFTQVSVGGYHTCALTTTQQIYCAGSGSFGEIGDGFTNHRSNPVLFGASLGEKFTQVSAGANYTCALTTTQKIYCVGFGSQGQLGHGASPWSTTTLVQFGESLGSVFTQVNAMFRHTCALTTTQKVYCAGSNEYGQLGDGTNTSSNIPVRLTFLDS